ncbi:MAG TPA: adenylate/guanylate cyclase domain-containing protein, partial [Candidatus Limnocylindrales bacterium]|nr:adenylate/guanylate cyclase domain-containing protein [Candidatus Limnocylindrales bacterium]
MVAPAETRPTVTLVTSDLKGSTALGERLDPEALREVLNRYFAVMRVVFESHGGRIEKIIGDAIVAVFGLPEPADDDALRAVEAAAESMRALATLNDELEAGWGVRLVTRTGVATGEVTFGEDLEGQHVLLGSTVDISGTMEQNAPPLEVLIHQSTRDAVGSWIEVEPMGPVSPKGSDERFESFRLVSVMEREHQAVATTSVADALPRDTRRTVTLVFALAKVHGVTGEEPGPGVLRDVMSRYFDAMRTALEHHGGTVEKYIGDAVMAVFGLPIRHEDDALRAVRAAADMQAALADLNPSFRTEFGVELHGLFGVNTGEVIASGDASSAQRLVTGDTVNTAARLEQAAGGGDVILGDLTYRLSRDEIEAEPIPPLTLKGKAEPVPAYRLVRVAHRSSTTSTTPFVGRAAELARLEGCLDAALSTKRARLVNVVGDAGVGKSRLIREFADRASVGANVLRGRCLPYGNGITFWPLNEAIGAIAGIQPDDSPAVAVGKIRRLLRGSADAAAGTTVSDGEIGDITNRVAAAINLSDAQFPVAELLWGARRLLEVLAREEPLVFIVDDIHSAEATFLDLVDAVVEAAADAPMVVLTSARQELTERHPEWSEAHAGDTITLAPLSDQEAGQVVAELLGALDEDVRGRISAAAEGNPLYLEQIVSMLVETRAIERAGDRWVARTGGELAIPPTVQALVAARLDALAGEERQVIEPASVIGLSFPEEALEELVEHPLRPILDAELSSLAGKELIRRASTADVVYRFGHLVIRDTAYGGLLKRVRAALHERFVVWAERVNRERGREQEFEEILGYHLEQAYRYRTDVGLVDDAAREVGERAAEKLSNAGRRALTRGDLPAAVSLLRRAIDLLPESSTFRVELQVDLAEGLLQQGAFDDSNAVLEEARSAAKSLAETRLEVRADLIQVGVDQFRAGGQAGADRAMDVAHHAIEALEPLADHAGLARAWRLIMNTSLNQGHFDEASEAAERVVSEASAADDQRLASRSASAIAYVLLHGRTPVPEAISRCEELLRSVEGDRKTEGLIESTLSVLRAMTGDIEAGRELYRRSQASLTELGGGIDALSGSLDSSRVELLAGDLEAAERELRRDYDALAALGESYFRSTVAARLASVLERRGKPDEALFYADVAKDIGEEDDVETQVGWRSARSLVQADLGMAESALELANEAVRLTEDTSDGLLRAAALMDLGTVLERLGDRESSGP